MNVKQELENQIYNELYELVVHQIRVTGLSREDAAYVLYNLFTRGWIVQDLPTANFYTGALSGVDERGRVTTAYGRTEDGRKRLTDGCRTAPIPSAPMYSGTAGRMRPRRPSCGATRTSWPRSGRRRFRTSKRVRLRPLSA